MVGDYIDHHPDALVVTSSDQALQLCCSSEMAVDAIHISSMIPVVAAVVVVHYRRYPNGVKAQVWMIAISNTFDVVEMS